MIQCSNCNKQLEDGTKFCDNCGKQIIETIFCQNCGKETSTEFAFCQNCGASLSEETVIAENSKKKKFVLPKLPFNISKKLIAVGSACIALVLVAVIVLTTLLSGGGTNNFALYLKDGEMYFTQISKINPWQVTTNLIQDSGVDNEDLVDAASAVGLYALLSNDGKIMFYMDKNSYDSYGATLFYRYVNKPEKEPTKIDSDISSYSVSESGKVVTYLKGEEGILYRYDLNDKEKIDSGISAFMVSDDGKKIGYINDEGGMYLKYAGKDKEKLDSDVDEICYINENFDTVYYLKEDSLYKKVEGKEKEKIASDVYSILNVYESGEIYYLKSSSNEVKLIDYIEDDFKESDSAMTEPQAPEYPSYWDYDDYDDYEAAWEQYETAYTEYQNARTEWWNKEYRDKLREELSKKTLTDSSYELCYYSGKEAKTLTDAFVSKGYASDYALAEDNPVIVFSVYNQSYLTKVKLSEIDYISTVTSMVQEALFSSSEKYISVKDNMSIIEQSDAESFIIASNGKTVYFLDDVSEETNHGDIYKMNISGNKATKPELYDNDAYSGYSMFLYGDKLVYYKDVKNDKGDLYVNKGKLDYDVYLYEFTYIEETDTVIYMTDYDATKDYGTLKMFKNGKAVKIADEVHEYTITPNGEVLYLNNYSTNYMKGDLFIYKNKKSEKIDDDVVAIVPIYDFKYRGALYNVR